MNHEFPFWNSNLKFIGPLTKILLALLSLNCPDILVFTKNANLFTFPHVSLPTEDALSWSPTFSPDWTTAMASWQGSKQVPIARYSKPHQIFLVWRPSVYKILIHWKNINKSYYENILVFKNHNFSGTIIWLFCRKNQIMIFFLWNNKGSWFSCRIIIRNSFFYIENNQIMILSVLEKNRRWFSFHISKNRFWFYDFTLNSVTIQDLLNSLWN